LPQAVRTWPLAGPSPPSRAHRHPHRCLDDRHPLRPELSHRTQPRVGLGRRRHDLHRPAGGHRQRCRRLYRLERHDRPRAPRGRRPWPAQHRRHPSLPGLIRPSGWRRQPRARHPAGIRRLPDPPGRRVPRRRSRLRYRHRRQPPRLAGGADQVHQGAARGPAHGWHAGQGRGGRHPHPPLQERRHPVRHQRNLLARRRPALGRAAGRTHRSVPMARFTFRRLFGSGEGWTCHDQPGALQGPPTEWADRGPPVGGHPPTELMADDEPRPTVGGLRDDDLEGRDWERVRPRRISDADWNRFEGYMGEILQALGMPLNTPGTAKTPMRYLRAIFDSTEGYEGDAKLVTAFPTECYGGPDCELSQVIDGPIPFYALCEHHAFPFFGHAYLGYVAHEHIIGISKLTRLVRLFARRFTVQERMGREITEALSRILQAHGVAVYL